MACALKEIIITINKTTLSLYHVLGIWNFQLGSVVNTKPFSCFLYTFSIDWGARIQSQGWMARQLCLSKTSLPRKQSSLIRTWQALASSTARLCQFLQRRWGRAGMPQGGNGEEKHQRRMEGVKDKFYNSTNSISRSGDSTDAVDLTTMLGPHKSFGFTEHSLCIRCDHGHPHV